MTIFIKESEWNDDIPSKHPNDVIVRIKEDGKTAIVYKSGCRPRTRRIRTPRYTNKPDKLEVNRG